jgi:hypothetical protein
MVMARGVWRRRAPDTRGVVRFSRELRVPGVAPAQRYDAATATSSIAAAGAPEVSGCAASATRDAAAGGCSALDRANDARMCCRGGGTG